MKPFIVAASDPAMTAEHFNSAAAPIICPACSASQIVSVSASGLVVSRAPHPPARCSRPTDSCMRLQRGGVWPTPHAGMAASPTCLKAPADSPPSRLKSEPPGYGAAKARSICRVDARHTWAAPPRCGTPRSRWRAPRSAASRCSAAHRWCSGPRPDEGPAAPLAGRLPVPTCQWPADSCLNHCLWAVTSMRSSTFSPRPGWRRGTPRHSLTFQLIRETASARNAWRFLFDRGHPP